MLELNLEIAMSPTVLVTALLESKGLSVDQIGMLTPNSRDQHEKWLLSFTLCKNTVTYALFEKSRLKCTSNTINNIVLISMKQKSK